MFKRADLAVGAEWRKWGEWQETSKRLLPLSRRKVMGLDQVMERQRKKPERLQRSLPQH